LWVLVFRKIIKNKWMMLCLLLGFVIVVSMVSSVPMYTNGILQKMLTEDLEAYQQEYDQYPGAYSLELNLRYENPGANRYNSYYFFKDQVENEFIGRLGEDLESSVHVLEVDHLYIDTQDETQSSGRATILLNAISNLEGNAKLISGRMYEPGIGDDGVYEVVVTEKAFLEKKLKMDTVYTIKYLKETEPTMLVRVVGIIGVDEPTNPFWYSSPEISTYNSCILMDYETFVDEFVETRVCDLVTESRWYYGIDYHGIKIQELPHLTDLISAHEEQFAEYYYYTTYKFPISSVLASYDARAAELKTTLWIIIVPVLVMLCFYIFMVSRLIVNNEENEISVMRSRGASNRQIFTIYLLEGCVLGAIAIALGPPIGLYLCKIMGSSNGFLEFINRSSIPVEINYEAYLYSVFSMVLFIATMLIPAYKTSRTTIVERKRKRSRNTDKPLWKRFYLDVLMIAVAIYGWYDYNDLSALMNKTSESGATIQIQPMLFLISSLFILGAGLLFIRIFPVVIRIIFQMGKKHWTPAQYASFIQVGRSSGQETFLMLFIILSLAVGIFGANTARTLNENVEDKISYLNGADLKLDVKWETNINIINSQTAEGGTADQTLTYVEPNFGKFEDIEGVEAAAKVFTNNIGVVKGTAGTNNVKQVQVLGIEPLQFAKVSWYRNDLLDYHLNEYMNLIYNAPKACLLSSSMQEKLGLDVGDTITLTWDSQSPVDFTIYGFVEYFPTYNIYTIEPTGTKTNDLIVCNLSYLQTKFLKEPYEVWLKKEADVTDTQIFNYIEEHNNELKVQDISYVDQQIVEAKNDPLLQGLNGMLTLEFVITMMISAVGYLIYWGLSIRSRSLQFGVFRAMGMKLQKVIGMIVYEQIMICVTAIAVGIVVGGITSDLYVPMLRMVYNIEQQAIPFLIVASRSDYYKIYATVGAMLALGVAILSRIISGIKITQALKLGED